jgi:molecular chaperone GrpE
MNSETYNNTEGMEDGLNQERDEGESTASPAEKPDPLAEMQEKLQETEKKYLYLYSEFENFRKRNERDRIDFLKFGHEGFLREMLQVLDNFERALEHARGLSKEKGSPVAQVTQGIEMVHYQMLEALRSQGVTPIQALGTKFDPALHEAVGEEEADKEPGTVIKEMQKGYLLHGRLLRAARVITAKN